MTGPQYTSYRHGPLRLHTCSSSVDIFIEGFGTCGMADGKGAVAALELYEGKWTLHVWADINQEDATHRIDLSGALDSQWLEPPDEWVTLCRRTDDPKLSWLEARFDDDANPIPHRRNGEAMFHSPILQVPQSRFQEAQDILDPIDDIPDDDPRWASPWENGGVAALED